MVDNPPFSILAQIVDYYLERNVGFFMFAPTLTVFQYLQTQRRKDFCCVVLTGVPITYENGAKVQTSFITNLDGYQVRIEPELRERIESINTWLQSKDKRELPKYEYPDYILTGKDYQLAKYGQSLKIRREDCAAIRQMDAQKATGKTIFGCGLLLSERAAAERAAAEREEAKKWQLSERELRIVHAMGDGRKSAGETWEDGQITLEEIINESAGGV